MNIENQTARDMYRQLTVGDVCDILTGVKIAEILIHVSPDPDAVGSAFAAFAVLNGGSSAGDVLASHMPPMKRRRCLIFSRKAHKNTLVEPRRECHL